MDGIMVTNLPLVSLGITSSDTYYFFAFQWDQVDVFGCQ